MTRRNWLALASVVLLAAILMGGTWALARSSSNPWSDGMHNPEARHGTMMRSGYSEDPVGRYGGGMMGGDAMMGGPSYGIAGTGEVSTLGEARLAAQRYAVTLDLTVGEVMEFTENYYAELVTGSGDKATEVLVDPETGAVRIEYGPAMMWNTDYGMHRWSSTQTDRVSAAEAQDIADRWLARFRQGATAPDQERFPGYYTLHTMQGAQVTGMLSVNAATGAVWYHGWHGDFVAMSDEQSE